MSDPTAIVGEVPPETFLRECCRSGAAARVLMHMDDAAAIACVLDAITDPHARVSEHAP